MFAVRSRPFPDVIKHAVMQLSDVRFFERVLGFHRAIVKGPLSRPQNVQRFVFVQLSDGADAGNQLFGFLRTNGRIPVGVFMVEDEVHFDLSFKRRWTSSSISWLAFPGFWSSSAIVCRTLLTSRDARSRVGCYASSANEPDFGTSA